MPNTFKVSEVLTIIKKKLHLSREQAVILLAQGKYLMKHDEPLSTIYEKYLDSEDKFLYVVYAEEQIYG